MDDFSRRLIDLIRSIPAGSVATYGQLALLAGKMNGARQVARLLHAASDKHALPWHRVINARGEISLPYHAGGEEQALRLDAEGVEVVNGRINLRCHLWRPTGGMPTERP